MNDNEKIGAMPVRDEFIFAVMAERQAQDKQWGGPSHDDEHVPRDWMWYIWRQINKATQEDPPLDKFEERYIKIAALALAAYESSKRKNSR